MIQIEGDKAGYSFRKEEFMASKLRGGFGGVLNYINYSTYHLRKAVSLQRLNKKPSRS